MASRYRFMQCRLCMYKNECLSDIYEDNGRQGFTAADLITDLLQFDVSETDGYPQLICLECLDKLVDFKRFKNLCENTKSIFERNYLSGNSFSRTHRSSKPHGADGMLGSSNVDMGELHWENENVETQVPGSIYARQHYPNKFPDALVKKEVEEYVPEKETMQENMKASEMENMLSCECEIKEEEVDINFSEPEYTSYPNVTVSYQEDLPTRRKKVFECSECGKCFVSKWKLERHLKVHEKGGPIRKTTITRRLDDIKKFGKKCHECGKSFASNWKLDRHLNVHTKVIPNQTPPTIKVVKDISKYGKKCNECGKCFVTNWKLERHLKTHQKGQSPNKTVPKFPNSTVLCRSINPNPIKEEQEGNVFPFGTLHPDAQKPGTVRKPEIYGDQGQVDDTIGQRKKPFQCSECNKCFVSQWVYVKHLALHCNKLNDEGGYLQPQPNFLYGDRRDTEYQTKRNITNDPYVKPKLEDIQCKVCGKTFPCREDFTAHLNSVHISGKYKCLMCAKVFKKYKALATHVSVHKQRKIYHCDQCDMKYTFLASFVKHKSLHSGLVKFKCNYCTKDFDHKIALSKHILMHTKKTFECKICPMRFSEQHFLNRHMLKHAREKPHVCVDCGAAFRRKWDYNSHVKAHKIMNEHRNNALVEFKGVEENEKEDERINKEKSESIVKCEIIDEHEITDEFQTKEQLVNKISGANKDMGERKLKDMYDKRGGHDRVKETENVEINRMIEEHEIKKELSDVEEYDDMGEHAEMEGHLGLEGHEGFEELEDLEEHKDMGKHTDLEGDVSMGKREVVEGQEDWKEHEDLGECKDLEEHGNLEVQEDLEEGEHIEDHEDLEEHEDLEGHDDLEGHEDLREHEDLDGQNNLEGHEGIEEKDNAGESENLEEHGNLDEHEDIDKQEYTGEHEDMEEQENNEEHDNLKEQGHMEEHKNMGKHENIGDNVNMDVNENIGEHENMDENEIIGEHKNMVEHENIQELKDIEEQSSQEKFENEGCVSKGDCENKEGCKIEEKLSDNDEHESKDPKQCKTCNKEFAEKISLEKHMLVHNLTTDTEEPS